MAERYDLAIIGSGPGGYVAAIRAAQLKMKTVIIEKEKLGGVCLNWGCIPTKALLKSAELLNEIKHAKDFGIKADHIEADFEAIIQRSRRVADMNSKGVEFLMKKNAIDVLTGSASFKSADHIEVEKDGKKHTINASHIIIATGGRPRMIPGIEADGENIITSKEAMNLKEKPASLAIVGAGAIGVEFAYFYNALGTEVTLIEMMERLLPLEDREISEILARSFKKYSINAMTSATVNKIEKQKAGVSISLTTGGKQNVVSAEKVLIAIGVQGNTEGLNLDAIGVKHEKSFIKVNEWYQTSVNHIYAIGDIVGPPLLAHVASHEGLVCVEKIAGLSPQPINYDAIPGGTYCQPQAASLGLTEEQARQKGFDVKIGRFPYSASGKARAIGARDGLVKLIFDKKYGELLGAHIIGSEATELIAELVAAKELETTAASLHKTMHPHPTLSEMIMEAAGDADGMAIHI
ncbi:MAG: dihydrolipoyl dehydrogenase [Calditrichaceae bacterium]|nr:dihydrolipoyl dehydrogenase [Calditrichaceae bacterium]